MPPEIIVVYDRKEGYGVAEAKDIGESQQLHGFKVICWCHTPQDAAQIRDLLSEELTLALKETVDVE